MTLQPQVTGFTAFLSFKNLSHTKNAAASDRRQKPYLSVDLKTAGFSTLHKQVAELQRACSLHYS